MLGDTFEKKLTRLNPFPKSYPLNLNNPQPPIILNTYLFKRAQLPYRDSRLFEWLGKIADEKEGWDVRTYKREKDAGANVN